MAVLLGVGKWLITGGKRIFCFYTDLTPEWLLFLFSHWSNDVEDDIDAVR